MISQEIIGGRISMINNPGTSSIQQGTMLEATYDPTGKKQDIFAYTDNKVADKVTSAQVDSKISSATSSFVTSSQVATQISSATSSFITSSAVDTKISDAISTKKPYDWSFVTFVPYTSSGRTISVDSYIRKALPIPIQIGTYSYEIILEYAGWGFQDASQTVSTSGSSMTVVGSFTLSTSSSAIGTSLAFSSLYTTAAIDNNTVYFPVHIHYIIPVSGTGLQYGWGFGTPGYSSSQNYCSFITPTGTSSSLTSGTYTYARLRNTSNKVAMTYGFRMRYRAISA